jgi:hypothetical protein
MRTSDPRLESRADERARSETVTEPRRLMALLKGLKANRTLLSARIGDQAVWHNTALLKLDPDTGDLFLDELSPREGHDQLRVGSVLHRDRRVEWRADAFFHPDPRRGGAAGDRVLPGVLCPRA